MTDNFIPYDPVFSEKMETSQSPFVFIIQGHDGKMMVSVGYDGTLTYGESYTPDAAAKTFWEAVGHTAPMKRIAELEAALKPIIPDTPRDEEEYSMVWNYHLVKARATLENK